MALRENASNQRSTTGQWKQRDCLPKVPHGACTDSGRGPESCRRKQSRACVRLPPKPRTKEFQIKLYRKTIWRSLNLSHSPQLRDLRFIHLQIGQQQIVSTRLISNHPPLTALAAIPPDSPIDTPRHFPSSHPKRTIPARHQDPSTPVPREAPAAPFRPPRNSPVFLQDTLGPSRGRP